MKPPKILSLSDAMARYPSLLDAVVDKVLAHKPKPKSKPARKRARRAIGSKA